MSSGSGLRGLSFALVAVGMVALGVACRESSAPAAGSLAARAEAARGEDAERHCAQEREQLLSAVRSGQSSKWHLAKIAASLLQHCPPSSEMATMTAAPVAEVPQAAEPEARALCAKVRAHEARGASLEPRGESRLEQLALTQWLMRAPQLRTACEEERETSVATRELLGHLLSLSPDAGTSSLIPPATAAPSSRLLRLHRAWKGAPVEDGFGQRFPVTVDVTCRPCGQGQLQLALKGAEPEAEELTHVTPRTRCATAAGWPADCADPIWNPFDDARRMLSTHVLHARDAGMPSRVTLQGRTPAVAAEPSSVPFEEGEMPELQEERVMPLFVVRSDAAPSAVASRFIAVLALFDAPRALRVGIGSRRGEPTKLLHLLELDEELRALPPVEGRPFYVPFRLLLVEAETRARDLPYSFSIHQPAPPGDVWLPEPLEVVRLHPEVLRRLQESGLPAGVPERGPVTGRGGEDSRRRESTPAR